MKEVNKTIPQYKLSKKDIRQLKIAGKQIETTTHLGHTIIKNHGVYFVLGVIKKNLKEAKELIDTLY